MNKSRYARQISLPEVGAAGQEQIAVARVLCVGVGGLGSPAALYLAAAGVGTIGLIDDDFVDPTNLQRQVLFTSQDTGLAKVAAGRNRLLQLNSGIKVKIHEERLNSINAKAVLNQYDLVIDGSDNFSTKFLLNDAAYKFRLPMVYGAVNGFEAQVALFDGHRGACYRCLHPKAPSAKIKNCAETGILGSIAGIAGSMQATLALQYLISARQPSHPLCPKIGELTLLDLRGGWNLKTLQINKNIECPNCSQPTDQVKLQSEIEYCTMANIIFPEQLQRLIENKLPVLLLDVRESAEWNLGHLPNARHHALSRLEKDEAPEQFPNEVTVVTYCQSGQRSKKAAQILAALGMTRVFSLQGGLVSWPGKLSK